MAMLPTGRALIDPNHVLEEAGLREEMKVADLGVGAIGHFLFPAAKLVGPKGMVFGVDILQSVLQANRSRAKTFGLDNIDFVWGNIELLGGTRLPDSSIDLALMVNVLHAVKQAEALTECRRILHSEGILTVVEWKPAGSSMGPSPEKRMAPEDVKKLVVQYGYNFKKEFEAGPQHYGMVFTKPLL
jgi:ubiquinone/menaquinone biosynthesis C-methylase UbiE